MISAASTAPDQAGDKSNDQDDDGDPEQNTRPFHCGAGYAAETKEGCYQCNHQEDYGVLKNIAAHGAPPFRLYFFALS